MLICLSHTLSDWAFHKCRNSLEKKQTETELPVTTLDVILRIIQYLVFETFVEGDEDIDYILFSA